jgi:adenine-specific DNA-methyltransferase
MWFSVVPHQSEARKTVSKLRKALRADMSDEAWATVNSNVSRPFPRPSTGKVAVKVINHYGDEVMKVFST